MADYGGSDLVDWADVAAVGVVAREYHVSPAAICLGGAIRREAQDGVDLAAAGLRHSAREIERLEERVGHMGAALRYIEYNAIGSFAAGLAHATLADDDCLRARRD